MKRVLSLLEGKNLANDLQIMLDNNSSSLIQHLITVSTLSGRRDTLHYLPMMILTGYSLLDHFLKKNNVSGISCFLIDKRMRQESEWVFLSIRPRKGKS